MFRYARFTGGGFSRSALPSGRSGGTAPSPAGVRRRESRATVREIPGSHPLTRGPAHVVDPVECRIAAPELVVELVRTGRLTEERLDASVRQLPAEKSRLELFDRRHRSVSSCRRVVLAV